MNLSLFNIASLFESATDLFRQLNIKLNSNTTESLPVRDLLKKHFRDTDIFKAIEKTFFIGTIDDGLFSTTGKSDETYSYKQALQQADKNYEGLMLFALELKKQPTRTEISELTRAFNRISAKMPVALLLKYQVQDEAVISICISERFKYLQSWRQGEKAGKVIILRDIHTFNIHRGHNDILEDLKKHNATNFAQLHDHWLKVLDVSILNKKFFQELANWYFWATDNVQFPDDIEKKKDVRNATNLIRLITRVIFIWFIKEKKLIPENLFRKDFLVKIVKDFAKNKKSENYYQAILQNLFFGTLNQKMNERGFVKEGNFQANKTEYGVKNLFRYADKFTISEKEVMALFKDVPFLNGGLFDCLDKPNEAGTILYVDGFSRNKKRQATVPDYLFFGDEIEIDLNKIFGTEKKKYKYKVVGLVTLLESYKFTVAENTPIEEEIALDPELLGKVFENLLASYNPETQTTARKQTGSFYTPREIVNYMVDESLLEYLKQNCKDNLPDLDNRLRDLFSYSENANPFNENETKILIETINNCKILDPACGSGAFPMGVLHKMVHILTKLDNGNKLWRELQKQKAIEDTDAAYKDDNKEERQKRLLEINDVFDNNASDYGRKLYLIENCIYGIDIQPIAVQIAKLRFFISLIIDQNKQEGKENFGIRSLPNLETKFVAANSLIGLDKPEQGMFRNPDIEEKEKELKELRHNYFTAKTRREKIQYQTQDKKLRKEIAKLLEDDGWDTTVAKQIVAFDPYDQNLSAPFFESEWMFGLTDGFDIVIGNPPYIQLQKDKGKLAKQYENCGYKAFERKGDIYALFYEKALQLLKHKGMLTYITSNKWMRAGYGKSLRTLFMNYNPVILIDLGAGVFETATVDTNILLLQNAPAPTTLNLKALDISKEKNISDFETYKHKWITMSSLSHEAWIILDPTERAIKTKIERIGKPLKEWDININYGIKTGYNEAFIIDAKTKDKLIAQDPKSAEIIKPILRGKDIKRYKAEFADLWLILAKYRSSEYLQSKYPAIYKRLLTYKPKLEKRGQCRYGGKGNLGQHHWLELDNNPSDSYLEEFEKEKIVWNRIASAKEFSLIEKGVLIQDSMHFIVGNNLKYLCSLLNSKAIKWLLFLTIGDAVGGNAGNADNIKNLVLPPLTEAKQQPFVTLAEQIIAKKEKGLDTTDLEKQIDEMVYKLYDLTKEEIKIVEGKS